MVDRYRMDFGFISRNVDDLKVTVDTFIFEAISRVLVKEMIRQSLTGFLLKFP